MEAHFKIGWQTTQSPQENELSQPYPQEAKDFYRKALNPLFIVNAVVDAKKTDDAVVVSSDNAKKVDAVVNEELKDNDAVTSTSSNDNTKGDKMSDAESGDVSNDANPIDTAKTDATPTEVAKADATPTEAAKVDATVTDAKADASSTDATKADATSSGVAAEVSKNEGKTDTAKKRRLPETEKKLAPMKAPKKARQEDDDTSEADSEAVSARKKEIEVAEPKRVDISDSESDAPKKNKPGPKRKKPGNDANFNFFVAQFNSFLIPNVCTATIFQCI